MNNQVRAAISKACVTATILMVSSVLTAQSAESGLPLAGYTFNVMYEFKGPSDAAYPWAGLVRAKDGNLYGTSWAGGAYPNCTGGLGAGCGALFRIDSSGNETVIYSFVGVPGPIHLYGELLPGPDGSFYGVTNEGGTSTSCYNGCGAVFRLDENGALKVLYNFGTNGGTSDANWPAGELVRDPSGNLYGTSSMGGTNNNGTIFKIGKDGMETVLYRFTGGTDGAGPTPSLLLDSAGNLYGTASSGGGACGCGTVFKLDSGGTLTVLYAFQGGIDGKTPVAGLIRDSAGNFFGTTAAGGNNACGDDSGCGIVYSLNPKGKETVLHAFSGNPDGRLPVSRLTRDKAGNLFGVTYVGGDSACAGGVGCGVVYEVTHDGKERVLHAFRGGKDGSYSWGDLYLDNAGDLIGTTQQGGSFDLCPNGCGVIFKVSPSHT